MQMCQLWIIMVLKIPLRFLTSIISSISNFPKTDLGTKYMSATYIESKIDNKRYCKTNGQFTRHLRSNNLTYQQYYETYITGINKTCSCGEPLTFYHKNETYANSCGNPICVGKLVSATKKSWSYEQKQNDSKNKQIAASKKTREQIEDQVAKSKETFKEQYGVEWVTQSTEFKNKSKKTKLVRYGNEYFNGNAKTSVAWQSKTKEEIDSIIAKRRASCLERFGVENAFMKPESRSNSAKSNSRGRDFVLPSGRIIGVRGHEDIAITKLLEIYDESMLIVDDRKTIYNLPVFDYIDHRRHNMKYYPDIHIPKENKLIEVKSQWWWDGNGSPKYQSRLKNNLRKKDAVLAAGYEYEVWLFIDKRTYKVLSWTK